MIDSLNPLIGRKLNYDRIYPAAQTTAVAKVQDEFLTIFYKELLKQAFKAPDLDLAGEEQSNENAFMSAYRSDIMVEQLAQEMVRNGSLKPNWFK